MRRSHGTAEGHDTRIAIPAVFLIYVFAAAMNRTLNLSVTCDGNLVGSYTDSIASVCQQYREAGGKDAALCTAILRYIQAVPGMND